MKYSVPEQLIRGSFFAAVWCLEQCSNMQPYRQKVVALQRLPPGTVGRAVADCLRAKNLTLVPGFESHDLKHVVLDYAMEPLGEIRMQAFMLGNGNWTVPSVAIFLFGLLLLPQHWRLFRADFALGQQCPALALLEIEDCQAQELLAFRKLVLSRYTVLQMERKSALSLRFSTLLSYGLLLTGVAAMVFCYPFLWSANVADLVGAGFPFVAGAIFVVGGVLSLTMQAALRAKETSTRG